VSIEYYRFYYKYSFVKLSPQDRHPEVILLKDKEVTKYGK